MTTPTTPEEAIEQNVLGPRSATKGDESFEQHSLKDQIEADRYLAAKTRAASPPKGFGLYFQKIVPPGAGE